MKRKILTLVLAKEVFLFAIDIIALASFKACFCSVSSIFEAAFNFSATIGERLSCKRLSLACLILSLFLFCGQIVLADEVVASANQEIVIEDNKAVFTVQKQPNDEKSVQKQDVKRNWFCIVIQVNGKVKDLDTNTTDK